MSEYTVGLDGDFKTLGAAAEAVKPGDVVNVRSGIYKERLTADTPGVTWQAAVGEWPVIDGGWDGTEQTGWATQVAVSGKGCIVRGLTIRNCPGRGVGVSASDVQILNNRVDRTYHGAILVGDSAGEAISGVLVAGNVFTNMSLSWVTEKRPSGVNGSFNIHNTRNSVVRDNITAYGWGECYNLGRGSSGVQLIGNIGHSTNHVLMYINRAQNCEVAGNWLFHIPDPAYSGKEDSYSAAIVFGDERSAVVARWPNSSGNAVRGNVIVNAGRLLEVRNNAKDAGGYDTALVDTVIEGNTFVGGPVTGRGISIGSNQRGRAHRNSVFRCNVVHFDHARAGGDIGTHGQGSGIAFERNAWSVKPPQSMQSGTDVYGELGLANAGAVIEKFGEMGHTTFDVENYRPRPESPLVTGVLIGALDCLDVEEPDPPEPDWAWLVWELEQMSERIAVAGGALVGVAMKVDELTAKFKEMG